VAAIGSRLPANAAMRTGRRTGSSAKPHGLAVAIGANCAILVEVILRDRVRRKKAPPEPFSAPSHPETGVPGLHGHHACGQTAWGTTARSGPVARPWKSMHAPMPWSNRSAKMEPLERRRQRCSDLWRIHWQRPQTMATLGRSRHDCVKDGSADGPAISRQHPWGRIRPLTQHFP
jgi:hypothetical protein